MQPGDKAQLDDREQLQHVIWQEQEACLSSGLGDLGHSYRQFRTLLTEYASLMGREESASPHTNKAGLPGDEKSKFLDRLLRTLDGPISIENFHQTAANVLSKYLSADPCFLKHPTWLEDHVSDTKDGLSIVAGEKVNHVLQKMQTATLKKLDKETMHLLQLYEQEETATLIREKRMKGFKHLMETDRYIKMDLQTQIRLQEAQRRETYEQANFLKLPESKHFTRNPDFLSSEDFMNEFLKGFGEKKDYAYVLFEDKLVELMVEEITSYHKNSRLESLLRHLEVIPDVLYSRQLSFAIDKYMTNSIVKGSNYVANKKSQSNLRASNLISQNLLEVICGFDDGNPLDLQKYASTQYYDNITISKEGLEILYNSYTSQPPSVLLVIKNLFGAYLEEVDNAEHIYYTNPLDSGFNTLSKVVKLFNRDLWKGFLGPNSGSIITADRAGINREDYVSTTFTKFDSGRVALEDLSLLLSKSCPGILAAQSQLLTCFDGEQIDRFLVSNSCRLKLKEKSNPNQKYLDQLNLLRPGKVIRMKKVPDHIMVTRSVQHQEGLPADLILHKECGTILDSLLSPDYELFRERMDIFTQKRKLEVLEFRLKETDAGRVLDVAQKIHESTFIATTVFSRNCLAQLLSFMNYFASVQINLSRKTTRLEEVLRAYDQVEAARLKFLGDLSKPNRVSKPKQSDTSRVQDDSSIGVITNRRVAPGRKVSFSEGIDERGASQEQQTGEQHMLGEIHLLSSPRERTLLEQSKLAESRGPTEAEGQVPRIKGLETIEESPTSRREMDSADRGKTFRLKLKELLLFDRIQLTDLDPDLLCGQAEEALIVKVFDAADQEILYDAAETDFLSLLRIIQQLVSFHCESFLVDFAFDAVSIKDVNSGDVRESHSTLSHVRVEPQKASQHLNIEYLVMETLRYETKFQAAKVRLMQVYLEVLDYSASSEEFFETREEINRLIKKRPDFDFNSHKILTQVISETCNSKLNHSSISCKDVAKEIQNFILTIFDSYHSSTLELVETEHLLRSIITTQKDLWFSVDILRDIRKRDKEEKPGADPTIIGDKRVRNFMELPDNLGSLSSIQQRVNKQAEELFQTLNASYIDQLTLYDFTVEENRLLYFKTMNIKYTENEQPAPVLGRGVKESTYLYFMRLLLQNQLAGKQAFIKSNLRRSIWRELSTVWNEKCQCGLAEQLLLLGEQNYDDSPGPRSPGASVASPSRGAVFQRHRAAESFSEHMPNQMNEMAGELVEKLMKENYYALEGIVNGLDDEKKSHILSAHEYFSKKGWISNAAFTFSRSKSYYSKHDWKSKLYKLNSVFSSYYQLMYQQGCRTLINSLELVLEGLVHQKNLCRTRNEKAVVDRTSIFTQLEEVLNMEEISTLRSTGLLRMLRSKPVSKAEGEDIQRKATLVGDLKVMYEYLFLAKSVMLKTLQGNTRSWGELIRTSISDLSKVLCNHSVAQSVVTCVGLSFDQTPLPNRVYEQETMLITAPDSGDYVLGSENESIFRRLLLQTIMDAKEFVIFDPLEELSKLKKEISAKYPKEPGARRV